MTPDDVKENLLQKIREWMDEPGQTQSLTIEVAQMPIPPEQGGGALRVFEIYSKNLMCGAKFRYTDGSRIVPASVIPPSPLKG